MSIHAAFIDVPVAVRQTPVYRIVSIERLYELFESRKNVLVSPSMWEDPFENFILKGQSVSRRGWFGQCWTRQKSSDAMWRIYSSDSKGIRLRSTPERLLASLGESATRGRAFIGTVRYLAKRPLMHFAQKAVASGTLTGAAEAARTLLVKRPAFRHESEVRLLYRGDISDKLFKYLIDPHALFDQLMLDPRLSPVEFETTRATIRARTGYAGSIKRSLLYAPPPSLLGSLDKGSPSNPRLRPTTAGARRG
jgi:hypothetical protein